MATSPDEALLVLRAQFGDREALEALLRGVRPSLLRYVGGIVGAEDAEDLIQDVLLLIYCRRGERGRGATSHNGLSVNRQTPLMFPILLLVVLAQPRLPAA